jgi:hypothetical protein
MSPKNLKIPLANAKGVTVLPEMWNQIQNVMAMFQSPALLTASPAELNATTSAASVAPSPSLPATCPTLEPIPQAPMSNDNEDHDDELLPVNSCVSASVMPRASTF